MFWGLIMEPNKRYTQTVEKPFHISQAAMDISTGDNDPCQVMVVVDQKNFLVCTLQKGKAIQVPLDLYFKAGASVAFLTNGKCNVHLTGYLDPEFEDDASEGDEEAEEEEEEEAPTLVLSKNKRKLDNSTDAAPTKKKAKKQAKKVAAEEEDSDSSDEDVDNNLQKLLNDDVDSDENDESFKINTSEEPDSSDEDSEDDEEEEEEEEDDDEKDEAEDSKAETTLDSSLDTSKSEEKKLSKSQKRRLKKKEKQQQAQVNGVEKAKGEKPDVQQKKGEKKQHEGKKQKEPEAKAGEKREKKTLTGGVFVEDLKVGDGPVAKSGKTVLVYYEGRLKQNNKMFDSCNKGPGFKFRLGSKEVISGWDVAIAGMKVGGKRKIVCPPAMAYGAKGSPPVIPPNSTLVFEVELKNVK